MSRQKKGPAGKQQRPSTLQRQLPSVQKVVVRLGNGLYSGPNGPVPLAEAVVCSTMKEARRHANHLRGLNWYVEAEPEVIKGG